jgi:arylformamidase
MKIYDISQEVFSCSVYPGDPAPQKQTVCSIDSGDAYNLTAFSMCAHNGTHIDAPFHFINDGKTVESIPLHKTVGPAYVHSASDDITAEAAREIIALAKSCNADSAKRILIKGDAVITEEAALVFANAKTELIGTESQSVGPEKSPMAVHKILLNAESVLLEGIRLSKVKDGVYFLSAAPISLSGADGSPCRAVLIEF